jgi:hypothetical protein
MNISRENIMAKKISAVPEPGDKEKLAQLNVMIPASVRKDIDIIGLGSPTDGARYIFALYKKQIETMAKKTLAKEKTKKSPKK